MDVMLEARVACMHVALCTINQTPYPPPPRQQQADIPSPASHLTALADHQVAPPILLHRLGALGAGLGVGCQPVARLTVAVDLLLPQLPHLAGAGAVGRLFALEAECHAAGALWLNVRVTINLVGVLRGVLCGGVGCG